METLLLVAFRTRCCLKQVLPLSDKRSMCAKASKLVQCGWGEPAAVAGGRPCPRAVPGMLSGASVSLSLSLEEPHSGRPDTGWRLGSPASLRPLHGCLRGWVGFTLPWRPGWLRVHSLRRQAVTVTSPAPTWAPKSALGPGTWPQSAACQRAVRRSAAPCSVGVSSLLGPPAPRLTLLL